MWYQKRAEGASSTLEEPDSTGRARSAVLWLAAVAVAVCIVVVLWNRAGRQRWSGEEPYKISESYYLRLALAGDVRNPAWFDAGIARSNPHFGDYAFGSAILLAGQPLPRDLSIQQMLLERRLNTAEQVRKEHLPHLAAARRLSVLAIAFAAALIVLIAGRFGGPVAGVVAAILFARHWIVAAVSLVAVHDALMTALYLLALDLWLRAVDSHSDRARPIFAVLAGLTCAAVFQTRVSGFLALCAILAAAAAAYLFTSRRDIITSAVVMTATMAVASILMNPYYWASPAEPVAALGSGSILTRIPHRLAIQVSEYADLARSHGAPFTTVRERLDFAGYALDSGGAGLGILIGLIAVPVVLRGFGRREAITPLLLWSAVVTVVLIAGMPVRSERVLAPAVSALAIVAGLGVAGVLKLLLGQRAEGSRTVAILFGE